MTSSDVVLSFKITQDMGQVAAIKSAEADSQRAPRTEPICRRRTPTRQARITGFPLIVHSL